MYATASVHGIDPSTESTNQGLRTMGSSRENMAGSLNRANHSEDEVGFGNDEETVRNVEARQDRTFKRALDANLRPAHQGK